MKTPTKISFFPVSLPDETLYSRFSRYHFLVGNNSCHKTYKDLFDLPPFALHTIFPRQVSALASRLPGDINESLEAIISENTLTPLYLPFIGQPDGEEKLKIDGISISSARRVPRHSIDDYGDARLCLACVRDDELEHGAAYWHRAHQAPNVTACWKHGFDLLKSCPECFRPFQMGIQPLAILWFPCECGWSCEQGKTRITSDPHSHQFAVLTQAILNSGIQGVDARILALTYRNQAIKLGYRYGKNVSLKKLEDGIISKFGEGFVKNIDKAYFLGRTSNWIRFSPLDGYLDMPVSRHILLIMFLFRNFSEFKIQLDIASQMVSFSKPLDNDENERLTKTKTYREKILQIKKRWPNLEADGFWKRAYKATAWLHANDTDWLLSVIDPTYIKKSNSSSKDEEYSSIIEKKIDELYRITHEKPLRVNRERILSVLPKRVPRGKSLLSEYPLVQYQLERNFESLWHFHIRRFLWGIMEVVRLGLPTNTRMVSSVSGINPSRCLLILEFYEIDLSDTASARFDPQFELSRLSVSNHFEGPPDALLVYGGRNYKNKNPRKDTQL